MFSTINRLYANKYLNSTVVLFLDMFVSLFASFVVLLLAQVVMLSDFFTRNDAFWWLGGAALFSLIFSWLFKTQRAIIRHTTLRSLARICAAVFFKEIGFALLFSLISRFPFPIRFIVVLLFDFLLTYVLLIGIRILMIYVYSYAREHNGKEPSCIRMLIYGTSDKSVSMLTRLSSSSSYRIVGFLSDNVAEKKMSISEYPVYSYSHSRDIISIKEETGVQAVLFATDGDARKEQTRLVKYCIINRLKVFISPSIDEMVEGKVKKQTIREIRIEDLLGRDEININIQEIQRSFVGKSVLVTGAAGSIGSELCRQLVAFGVKRLCLFDNAETPMHNIRLELEDCYPELEFVPIIGDVRMNSRLDYAFRLCRPQIVFHAAAYKHVPLMEENPCESVSVNVMGSRNVADKCVEYDVDMMVMVSTDKAVNPTNIMGCTKRLAEIYVQALGLAIEQGKHPGRTKFVTTRFGNVLGSNGSVIPRFREQIAKGGPVTVTHSEITRFFMTISEACRLVMEAAVMSVGNQIFIFDMGEPVKIDSLAKRMIELAGLVPEKDIKIMYIGLRPGEKLYEEVLANSENTIPTDHHRIHIAKVRDYNYNDALKVVEELEALSLAVEIPDMVRLMKHTVPEFKSKNSMYEAYDKEIEIKRI